MWRRQNCLNIEMGGGYDDSMFTTLILSRSLRCLQYPCSAKWDNGVSHKTGALTTAVVPSNICIRLKLDDISNSQTISGVRPKIVPISVSDEQENERRDDLRDNLQQNEENKN